MQSPVSRPQPSHLQVELESTAKRAGHDRSHMSLLDLLHGQPAKRPDIEASGFKTHFAALPAIAALDGLSHQAYIDKAMAIRASVENDNLARKNLRKALWLHMDAQKVDKDTVTSVMSRYDALNNLQLARKSIAKARHIDEEAFKAKRRKLDQSRRDQAKLKRAAGKAKELSFEEQMVLHHVPLDADAFTIEAMSRKCFRFGSNKVARHRLRQYLQTRFSPSIVRDAMDRRSFELRKVTHNATKGTIVQRKKMQRTETSVGEASTSQRPQKTGSNTSSSSASLTKYHMHDINNLDDTEWWNDL